MNKLDEMWVALEAYLPQAIDDGHGDSWAKMCSEKTVATAYAAWCAAYDAVDAADLARAAAADAAAAAAADARDAADAAARDAADADADYWAKKALDRITKIMGKH
jgi:hypothetical protein